MNFFVRRRLARVQCIFTVGTVGRVRETTGPRLGEAIGLLARGEVEAGKFNHFVFLDLRVLQAQQWRTGECESIPRTTQSRRGELELQRQLPGDNKYNPFKNFIIENGREEQGEAITRNKENIMGGQIRGSLCSVSKSNQEPKLPAVHFFST